MRWRWWSLDDSVLTEPSPAPEFFCNDVGRIELIGGGCARFYLVSNQTPVEAEWDGAVPTRVVVCKVVAPVEAVPRAMRLMAEAVTEAAAGAMVEAGARMVS